MKYILTITHLSRTSRRRAGKARTEVIDTDTHPAFKGLTEPLDIERRYEEHWDEEHPGSHSSVKVVDVREAREFLTVSFRG